MAITYRSMEQVILERANKVADAAVKKAAKIVLPIMIDKMYDNFIKASDNFYGAYDPKRYRRAYDMYYTGIFQYSINDLYASYDWTYSMPGTGNGKSDAGTNFELSFGEGVHGNQHFTISSASPFNIFIDTTEEYFQKELQPMFQNLVQSYFQEMWSEVSI